MNAQLFRTRFMKEIVLRWQARQQRQHEAALKAFLEQERRLAEVLEASKA
ncbi:hypothetical protein NCHU2750_58170 (plasmid) [Neorhizobium sp. NCHU2750]|nr:hypothetical protein NCHU2750_58170 [Neorhizobium sp. NCHU2750]